MAPTEPNADQTNSDVPSTTTSNTTNAQINNCVNSGATSGDATVINNDNAGSATTGDAETIANIINLIQSSGLSGEALNTFIFNIIGEHNGDIPIKIEDLLAFMINNPNCGCSATVQTIVNAQINNNINLNANSGDATVAGNGAAGDATSGDATVMANIINMINSLASSGQSFLGIINILGTLNGDILLPAGWYDKVLEAAGMGGGSATGGGGSSTTNVDINNNINVNASSGDADVSHNGIAGDAGTGNALTNINIINMVNRSIVGANVLLVFVNVLGHWVGILMDQPVGTTSAILGDTSATNTDCGCGGSSDLNAEINNNINLNAHSGNASVNHNGTAGNATTGNATASLNLVNIVNSQLSLANWFGILFINVLGTWNGSLRIDTPIIAIIIPVTPAPAASNTRSTAVTVRTTTTAVDSQEEETSDPTVLASSILGDDTELPVLEPFATHPNYLALILVSAGCYCALGLIGRLRRLF
jgi:hypothetical protein